MERLQNAEGCTPWPGGCGEQGWNALARPRSSPCSPAALYGLPTASPLTGWTPPPVMRGRAPGPDWLPFACLPLPARAACPVVVMPSPSARLPSRPMRWAMRDVMPVRYVEKCCGSRASL